MAILSRPKISPQQRLDLEDWDALLSSLRTDAKLWTKQFLSSKNLILKGFNVSGVGFNAATIAMADATLILPQNTSDFSYFTAAPAEPNITISDAELTDGVRNYVELSLATQDGVPLSKAFWDPNANSGEGLEFTQIVNTITDIALNVEVSIGGFSGDPDKIPLAIIDTDGTGAIKVILDRRELFGRLSTPSDIDNDYTWGAKQEPVYTMQLTGVTGTFEADEEISIGGETATVVTGGTTNITFEAPSGITFGNGDAVTGANSGATGTIDTVAESFTGVDKNLGDLEEVIKALMTEIKNLKGTRFWWQDPESSLVTLASFVDSVMVQEVLGAKWSWDGSELSITDDDGSPADADHLASLRQFGKFRDLEFTRQDGTGGSTTITVGEEQVVFIEVPTSGDRTYSGVGASNTNYQVVDRADFVSNNENYWIAYRENGLLYVRGVGELEAGEDAPISDPDKETILALIQAQTDRANQDRNTKLIEGGTWSLVDNAGTYELTLSEDAYAQMVGISQARNTISAQTISLPNANSVAYIEMTRDDGVPVIKTVNVADDDVVTLTDDTFVIARRVSDGVLVGKSFLLQPGELLTLDGALAEINKYFGQLRLKEHPSNGDRVIVTGADISKLDGSTLSQTLSSLLVKFDGAEIDFETGEIFESDGTTPLGVDFVPANVPATEWQWYSVTMVPAVVQADNTITAQLFVLAGNGTDAVRDDAPRAAFATGLPLGQVAVQQNAGDTELEDIVQDNIVQLGVGAGGGGSGTGDASSWIQELMHRFKSAPFSFMTITDISIEAAEFIDEGSSTGSYSIVDQAFNMESAETLISEALIDPDVASEVSVRDVEVYLEYAEDNVDADPTVEASLDGGSTWSEVEMERLGTTERYSGALELAPTVIPSSSFLQEKPIGDADSNLALDDSSSNQALGQKFTLAEDTTIDDISVWINKAGSPLGNFTINIYGNDVGNSNLPDSGNVVYTSADQDITALSAGTTQVTVLPNQLLTAGIYHLVIETDAAYKASQVNGLTEIRWRSDSTGVPWTQASYSTYNGTSWSGNFPPDFTVAIHEINGTVAASSEPEDLRLRLTASETSKLTGFAALYGLSIGSVVSNEAPIQVFDVNGDDDQTTFTITNFLPDPNIVKMFVGSSGQVFRYGDGAFTLDGYTVTVPAGSFLLPGETFKVTFDQSQGGGFDNSDANAALLAANHLGSTDPTLDKSSPGRGPIIQLPNGQKVELKADNDRNLILEDV